jgi:hypothetical protein
MPFVVTVMIFGRFFIALMIFNGLQHFPQVARAGTQSPASICLFAHIFHLHTSILIAGCVMLRTWQSRKKRTTKRLLLNAPDRLR